MIRIRPKKTHFEDLWTEAEEFVSDNDLNIQSIKELLEKFECSDNKGELFGQLLFKLSAISKKHNINVAAALLNEINNIKIDTYE